MKKREPKHSDHFNPRDNFATFDNTNIPEEKRSFFRWLKGPVKMGSTLLAALFVLLCLAVLLGHLRPDLFPYFTYDRILSTVSAYLPDRSEKAPGGQSGSGSMETRKEPAEPETTDRVYTQAQVEQVKRELLLKKRIELAREKAAGEMSELDNSAHTEKGEELLLQYSYEIELFSGTHIFTDNVQVTEDTVSYTDPRGLHISINREDVKKVTRSRTSSPP